MSELPGLIDGAAIAAAIRLDVATSTAEFVQRTGVTPTLATVLVGDDPASEVYVRNKRRTAEAIGIRSVHEQLPGDVPQAELEAVVARLAADETVSGILVQLPLPEGLDSSRVIDLIPWYKDVDGLTTTSAGLLARNHTGLRPCTPSGVLSLIDAVGVPLDGSEVVVIGRSELVGRPVAQLLLQRNATVTMAHSRTKDLREVTRRADIVVVAAGVPGLIGRDDVRPGAVVIDVGIHRDIDGKLRGDVRFDEVVGHAGHVTPVPGGVGPMTIAELMKNTIRAAELGAERVA